VNICDVLGFDAGALRARLFTPREDASDARRRRVLAPIRTRAMTIASSWEPEAELGAGARQAPAARLR